MGKPSDHPLPPSVPVPTQVFARLQDELAVQTQTAMQLAVRSCVELCVRRTRAMYQQMASELMQAVQDCGLAAFEAPGAEEPGSDEPAPPLQPLPVHEPREDAHRMLQRIRADVGPSTNIACADPSHAWQHMATLREALAECKSTLIERDKFHTEEVTCLKLEHAKHRAEYEKKIDQARTLAVVYSSDLRHKLERSETKFQVASDRFRLEKDSAARNLSEFKQKAALLQQSVTKLNLEVSRWSVKAHDLEVQLDRTRQWLRVIIHELCAPQGDPPSPGHDPSAPDPAAGGDCAAAPAQAAGTVQIVEALWRAMQSRMEHKLAAVLHDVQQFLEGWATSSNTARRLNRKMLMSRSLERLGATWGRAVPSAEAPPAERGPGRHEPHPAGCKLDQSTLQLAGEELAPATAAAQPAGEVGDAPDEDRTRCTGCHRLMATIDGKHGDRGTEYASSWFCNECWSEWNYTDWT